MGLLSHAEAAVPIVPRRDPMVPPFDRSARSGDLGTVLHGFSRSKERSSPGDLSAGPLSTRFRHPRLLEPGNFDEILFARTKWPSRQPWQGALPQNNSAKTLASRTVLRKDTHLENSSSESSHALASVASWSQLELFETSPSSQKHPDRPPLPPVSESLQGSGLNLVALSIQPLHQRRQNRTLSLALTMRSSIEVGDSTPAPHGGRIPHSLTL
jgi:hypothetical protein